jgi:hypothetical protein
VKDFGRELQKRRGLGHVFNCVISGDDCDGFVERRSEIAGDSPHAAFRKRRLVIVLQASIWRAAQVPKTALSVEKYIKKRMAMMFVFVSYVGGANRPGPGLSHCATFNATLVPRSC